MIKILLFAGLKDRVGSDFLEWSNLPITVGELRKELKAIKGLETIEHVMVAVNEAYATDETEIRTGDTVALLPPVSGG